MQDLKSQLLQKIEDRSAVVAVVGLGYVGLPLALEFARAGFRVIGYDVSRRVVDALDVHMMISAFCVFRVSNRHTFTAIFGRDLLEHGRREHYRRMVGDLVVEYLTAHVGRG